MIFTFVVITVLCSFHPYGHHSLTNSSSPHTDEHIGRNLSHKIPMASWQHGKFIPGENVNHSEEELHIAEDM